MTIFSRGKLERPNARLSIRAPYGMHFGVKRHHWSFLVCVHGWMTCICCMTYYICDDHLALTLYLTIVVNVEYEFLYFSLVYPLL